MSDPLDRTIAAAIAAGILPEDAVRPAPDGRPWPVILLTALGAWLVAVPLLLVIGLLLGDLITRGLGPYLMGTLILAGAVLVLRGAGPESEMGSEPGSGPVHSGPPAGAGHPGGLGLFLEQLAVPALLVGCGTLAFGLFRDLSPASGAALLTLLALALAALLPRPWLRVLLGAAAAGLLTLALLPGHWFDLLRWGHPAPWLALHGVLAGWLGGLWAQWVLAGQGATARLAGALESIGAGWLAATLAGLALLSGMTLLVGANLDPMVRDLAQALTNGQAPIVTPPWMRAGSSSLAMAGVGWGAWVWPGLRRPWVVGVGLVGVGLAWFLPSLGGLWLALMVTATTGRWRLAGAAALALAWVIGAFYYQLQWPLGTKALVLAGAGAALGALVWLATLRLPRGDQDAAAVPDAPGPRPRGAAWWLIALAGLATLTVANLGIWQKEALIAQGRPVFIELAPIDPRSLMQGDFMRLNFRVPPVPAELGGRVDSGAGAAAPRAVARVDTRGVATLLRLAKPDEVLAEGELLLALTQKNGRWTLASDAWYFKEGEAARWQGARYGEFRVAPDGQALLVGLADGDLRRLGP